MFFQFCQKTTKRGLAPANGTDNDRVASSRRKAGRLDRETSVRVHSCYPPKSDDCGRAGTS